MLNVISSKKKEKADQRETGSGWVGEEGASILKWASQDWPLQEWEFESRPKDSRERGRWIQREQQRRRLEAGECLALKSE